MAIIKIKDLETEVEGQELVDNYELDVRFGNEFMIRIERTEGGWRCTNAVDGWGRNCAEDFTHALVTILD